MHFSEGPLSGGLEGCEARGPWQVHAKVAVDKPAEKSGAAACMVIGKLRNSTTMTVTPDFLLLWQRTDALVPVLELTHGGHG